MNVRYIERATPDSIAGAAAELDQGPGQVLAVLVAEQERPDLDHVVRALRRLEQPFFGGLFPGLLYQEHAHQTGALVAGLPSSHEPVLITNLDRPDFEVPELNGIFDAPADTHTAIVLTDGLSAHVARLLSELFGRLGNRVHYIGGGAGSLSLKQEPCVFTRDGVFQDAAVVGFVRQHSKLGVRHGWTVLQGPVVATRTEGNRIYELNWKTAFDVYCETLSEHVDEEVTRENLFSITKSFPFGIYKEGHEDVVRDPVAVGEQGELICVGEVPENAVLNILRGDHDSLLAAASQAAEDSLPEAGVDAHSVLLVDCVSRTIFLGDQFEEELDAVRARLEPLGPDVPLWGMLSLGEISSHGTGYVEFFNKTIVSAVLHD